MENTIFNSDESSNAATNLDAKNNKTENLESESKSESPTIAQTGITNENRGVIATSMDLFQTNDKAAIIRYENNNENEEKVFKIGNEIVDYNSYLKTVEEGKYSRRLIYLEYISIALTVISFIVFAILAFEDDSVSAFAFSVDSFLDVLTYIVIIWRFSNSADIHSTKKDRKALLIVGLLFVFSAVGVEYESIHNLVYSLKPIPSFLFIITGIFESILFGLLAILKFMISKKFENNKTIISDGINSLIASASALSMTIGMAVYVNSKDIWYLDAIFGFFMGFFVFIYGCKLIIDNTCFHK